VSSPDQLTGGIDAGNAAAEQVWSRRARLLLRHLPVVCGAVSIAIGTFVLIGWLLGRLEWTTILPNLPAMTANSALMAVFAGIALILAAPPTASRERSVIRALLALTIAVIATLTLAEHILGVDFGIDRVIASPEPIRFRQHLGRPSPQTATAFLLLAASLIVINRRTARGRRPAEALALLAGIIPLVALLGYIFGSAALYGPFALYPYTGMGVATAVALIALSAGTMAARAEVGVLSVFMASDSGGLAARQLVTWLFVLAVVTCTFELGARLGLYSPTMGSAFIALFGATVGSALILSLSRRLSRIDAERNAIQEQLRRSRERFDLALQGAKLAAWDWHVNSGEVIYSPRWAEMRGYRPDEISPTVESWRASVHPDDRAATEQALTDHFRGRTPEYESEHRIHTKSGDWIWVLGRGKVFERDGRGRPTRMVGTALDITARKRLETELRLAEARSSGILSISADAIVSMSDDHRITSFNEGATKIFGYSNDEIIGAPIETLMPERFRRRHQGHVAKFAAAPEASRHMGERAMVIVGLRKNGEKFPVDAAISKLEVGGTRIFTVALRDMTEQQRREREQAILAQVGSILAASLDYETTLPEVAQLAVGSFADFCVADLLDDGDVRRLTAAHRDPSHLWIRDTLLAVPAGLLREGLLGPVLVTKRASLTEHARTHALLPGTQAATRQRLVDAIGLPSVISAPLLAHGKPLGAITFIRTSASRPYDQPDLRVAEAIAERAALSIESGQLYRAAQRAIQARDDMMGIVAHDLRNPLGTILMQASFLRDLGVGEGENLASIERAAKRMNRLIQDLLDVTRMEAGRLSLEHEPVDTRRLLADAVESQQGHASSAKLDLRLEVPPDTPAVRGDRDRLLQVFENLIGNAIKFTEPGGRITVAARPRSGEVVFSVSDTGAGVEPEDVPHLFDRFWQARGTGREGAGLGLPIVKGLVEAHGGRIWVESEPLRGSTFYFAIPAAARPEAARPKRTLHG
jgi:PAS domain S-box-containing protein